MDAIKKFMGGMFTNIGKKIQMLVKILFYVQCGLGVIGGVVSFFTIVLAGMRWGRPMEILGAIFSGLFALVLVPVVTCVLAWLGSLMMMGFGKIVENNEAQMAKTQE